MTDPLDALQPDARPLLVRRAQPSWVDPTLATLTDDRFSDPAWIFEPKFDGERCLAFRDGSGVRLLSRNRKQINDRYPELVEALAAQRADDFVVDGEIVAFEGGVSSFARLQPRMQVSEAEQARDSGVAVYLYVFDVLHACGHDVRKVPLRERKAVLRELLSFRDPLRYTTHRNTDGEDYWEKACRSGWEGVIAKHAEAPYRVGRSRGWLKFKCENAQEFVIGGYTDPRGGRAGLGALLLGFYSGDDLVYAGKVGTGFDEQMLQMLRDELEGLKRGRPAFDRGALPRSGVHWVEPRLVGQVAFTEWTQDGQLRHPRFQGLRRDKKASEVVKEQPS
ncbi:MAG: ATP-dependent DNA ligase [Streptosporangiales bacterium]|nr:ATP-dependent DNA ligase [Streptosporangiales bacterium]